MGDISKVSCIDKIKGRYKPRCYEVANKSELDLQRQFAFKNKVEQSRCSSIENASDYIRRVIFPSLKPAMEKMIYRIIRKDAIEEPKQMFDCIDYLAEVLWNKNPKYLKRESNWTSAYYIFREMDCLCHRPEYPLHWILPPEVAAILIQARFRGYLTRQRPKIKEVIMFWKKLKEEKWKLTIPPPKKEIQIPERVSFKKRVF